MRVRSVTYTRQRKKKHYRRAKGSYATKKNRWRMVKQHLRKVNENAYTGRKDKKLEYRRLWVMRINSAARELCDMTYSQLIHGLTKAQVSIDRKGLAELAVHDPDSFKEIAQIAKQSVAA